MFCLCFTFLVHEIVGTGFPEALHSNVTVVPFLTSTVPSDVTLCIRGGTVTKNT